MKHLCEVDPFDLAYFEHEEDFFIEQLLKELDSGLVQT